MRAPSSAWWHLRRQRVIGRLQPNRVQGELQVLGLLIAKENPTCSRHPENTLEYHSGGLECSLLTRVVEPVFELIRFVAIKLDGRSVVKINPHVVTWGNRVSFLIEHNIPKSAFCSFDVGHSEGVAI